MDNKNRSFSMIADVEGDFHDLTEMEIPDTLPILAVRNLVLFPGVVSPILIGREASMALIRKAEKNNMLIGVFTQRDPDVEMPIRSDLYDYGVIGKVLKTLTLPNGNITTIVQGLGRIKLEDITKYHPYLEGHVTNMPEEEPDKRDVEFQTAMEDLRQSVNQYVSMSDEIPDEAQFALKNVTNNIMALNFICSMQFNTFLNYYKNAPEILQPSEKGDRRSEKDGFGDKRSRGDRRSRGGERTRTAEAGYTRLFINLGKKDGINPKVFMGFINRVAQGARIDLGRIDLMQNFSFFEVPEQQTKTVLNVLNGTDFDGRKVNVEVTDQPEGQRGGEKKRGGKEGGSFRSSRGSDRNSRADKRGERRHEEKKGKKGSGVIRGAAAKPSREERGYTSARGPKGAAEWAKFFEGQVESQPFYENFKKKKKK